MLQVTPFRRPAFCINCKHFVSLYVSFQNSHQQKQHKFRLLCKHSESKSVDVYDTSTKLSSRAHVLTQVQQLSTVTSGFGKMRLGVSEVKKVWERARERGKRERVRKRRRNREGG